jgi:beta-glucanase (GH16 family)
MIKPKRNSPAYGSVLLLSALAPVLCGCGAANSRAHKAVTHNAVVPKAVVHNTSRRRTGPMPLGVSGSWRLVLNSTFDKRSLDTKVWRRGWFGTGISGPINSGELACYSSANVRLTGQDLAMRVTKSPSTCESTQQPYTGAVLSTNPSDGRRSGGFTFTYGVAQAKIYVPSTAGSIAGWPVFATFGQHWPRTGEDDILEGISGTVCSRFHGPQHPVRAPGGCDPAVTPGWHTFTAKWMPESVTWYYDGVRVFHEGTDVTSAPMYVVLANTVARGWPQFTKVDTMKVAYVRVWQPTGSASSNVPYRHTL